MILAFVIVATVSCKTIKTADVPNARQGVEGYIYELSGNQMPMKGKPTNSNKRGVKREVYIYQATSLQQTQGSTPLFDKVNTQLILKTTSNIEGRYKAYLPAGNYSVFIKENGKLFAAETDATGILNLIAITLNEMTHRDVTITVNAPF
ncbi:hypothetical protein [Mucilaginibacter sp. CSA2-8R]|uniref:hypothetical protein n=1 Tax=Mucilaginibacter sp. CSA2-8R TaxID=3141542 RepID=UPI00315CCDCB